MPNSDQMVVQRHLCGVIGLLLVLMAVVLYVGGASNSVIVSGSLRAGSLLMVTWLAWPKLIEWRHAIPRVALSAAIILGVILVARPSWGKIAAVVAAVTIGGSLVGRWLSTWKQNG